MQRRLFIFLVTLFYVCVAAVWAQETGQVVVPISGDYIREWLVLGPFFPDDMEKDFLAGVGGEANIDSREGDTVTISDGRTLTWKRYAAKGNIIDLLDAVGDHENATAYAFCVLQSGTASDSRIYFASDDGAAVWINGKQVHSNPDGAPSNLFLDSFVFEADLKAGANRCLIKVSQRTGDWRFAVRMDLLPLNRAVISGTITNEKGEPIPNAAVRLEQARPGAERRDGEEIARTRADASGSYRLDIHPVRGTYDLSAISGELGSLQLGMRLREGERRILNLTLREVVSVEGTLLMLDDKTPHVAVPVQAMRNGKVIATTWSNVEGRYRFVNLKPGQYQLRCQVLGGYVYYQVTDQALRSTSYDSQATESAIADDLGEILHVQHGKILKNIDFRFAAFKKGIWKNYTSLDGLAHNRVETIHGTPDGVMWFGTYGGGVSRYDGKEFVNLTTEDGLVNNQVSAIHRDPDGVMWFGTNGGVSRYDGKEFVNLTTEDGLVHNVVEILYRDPDGVMWFGTTRGGISRYDGKGFVNFTTEDGLASNTIYAIHRDPDGVMWFGTEGGISRYDGQGFVNFTTEDGLAGNWVNAIHRDPDGVMWFATGRWGMEGGVSRYDGKEFVNLTTEDGLVHSEVRAIHRDPDGMMWFGTWDGVSRYDGKEFTNLTTEDGLVGTGVFAVHGDPDGMMWFGTGWPGDGIFRYDGEESVNFTTKDGLAHNRVHASHCDPDGVMWFGTDGGVSRYDGKEFVNFTTEDGLAANPVHAIYRDPDGVMWFGLNGGVSRYDDSGVTMEDSPHFVNFTRKDGLANNRVFAIHCDLDGVIWFGTAGGVYAYDGTAWTSLDTRDGLAGNNVSAIVQDSDGFLWFGTERGITRYRPSTTPPKVHIASVTTDQTYRDLSAIPALAIGTRVTMEYDSIDLKTVPEKRQYRCRIYETRDTRHETGDWRRET